MKKVFPYQSSEICLGIDPLVESTLSFESSATFAEFSQALCVHEEVLAHLKSPCVLKPNLAFFLKWGSAGLTLLEKFCTHYRNDHTLLLDAKFGEIDTSLQAYLEFCFSHLGVSMLTLNPFLGEKTISQAVEFCLKKTNGLGRIYVLCATTQYGKGTNKQSGLGVLQSVPDIIKVCQEISCFYQKNHAQSQPVGLVVGATRLNQLSSEVLTELSTLPLLCPGVGAQGACVAEVHRIAYQYTLRCVFPVSRGVFRGGRNSVQESLCSLEKITQELHVWNPCQEHTSDV